MIRNKLYNQKLTRWFVLGLRILVGAVFAFSGFVKAIDPWGVLYKFEEYIVALGVEWLSPFVLFGAIAVSVFEFVLGVMLIVGAYRRISVWLALFTMLVMTPLTLWLALTNAVPDCGCFGEALMLSNWATFGKNILLLIAILYLLLFNVRLSNVYSPSIQWIVTTVTALYIALVAFYGYFYQPMIDFRPYKVGTAILPGNEPEEADFVFVYEKDGVKKEFAVDEIPSDEDTAWTFVERKERKAKKGDSTENVGLTLREDDEDVTSDVIKQEGEQIILVFSDMTDIDITYTYLINVLDDFARKHNVDIIGVTGASDSDIDDWNDMSMATYPIYSADDTELKVFSRGNPSVVYLKDGKIVWKRTLQSINVTRIEDAVKDNKDLIWIASDYDGDARLQMFSVVYLSIMVLILILNRSYRVYKFSARLIKKNRK